jgi:hypothetical protein
MKAALLVAVVAAAGKDRGGERERERERTRAGRHAPLGHAPTLSFRAPFAARAKAATPRQPV